MLLSRSVKSLTRPTKISARRIRGWLLVVAASAAGITVGLAAAEGSGPFAGLHPQVASHLAGSDTAWVAINADAIFPSPPPPPVIHKVVTVIDPPPAAPRLSAPPKSDPEDQPAPAPPAPVRPTPSPSPGGGDN